MNKNVEGKALTIEGQTYETGLGMNAQCTLVYNLPEGHKYKTFRALCGYDSSCDADNTSSTGTTMDFQFYVTKSTSYTFDLTQLGYSANETVPVHDIWAKEDIGTATGTISAKVPSHGVKLYRLGDNKASGIDGTEAETPSANGSLRRYLKEDTYYNASGQAVMPCSTGMYIKDNKKVIMR